MTGDLNNVMQLLIKVFVGTQEDHKFLNTLDYMIQLLTNKWNFSPFFPNTFTLVSFILIYSNINQK